MGDDYIGRDGWHIGRPVREITDEYVRGQFLDEARKMLNTLQIYRRPQKIREKLELQDEDREKVFSGQSIIVNPTDEFSRNPDWYITLHWDPKYLVRRKGRFRRKAKYVGTKGPDYRNPKTPNRSGRFYEMYKSLIERPKITKALEEIVSNQDSELKVYSRVTPRIKIIDGKRKRVRLKTQYLRGNNVMIIRELIADRLVEGYVPEQSEGRPYSDKPGDNQVRAYFGLGPLENPWAEIPREEESTEIKTQEEPETRQPGEDEIESENQEPEVPSEYPKDDIPF